VLMMPQELKRRKKAPRTWSQAHSPPLGIFEASRTLGCADRTGSNAVPACSSPVASVACTSFSGGWSTAVKPKLRTESEDASEGSFSGFSSKSMCSLDLGAAWLFCSDVGSAIDSGAGTRLIEQELASVSPQRYSIDSPGDWTLSTQRPPGCRISQEKCRTRVTRYFKTGPTSTRGQEVK
jgi:hypothetical protein